MIRKISYTILLLANVFLCTSSFIYAQSHTSDSLVIELEKVKHDTNKVNILIELAEIFRYSKPDSALIFAETALSISQEIDYDIGKIKSYQNIGVYHLFKSNYPLSMENLQYALNLALKSNDLINIAKSFNNIGTLYFQLGAFSKSLEYYQKSLEIKETLNIEKEIGNTLNNIALIQQNMGNFSLSKEYFKKSLVIKEKGKDSLLIGVIFNNLGLVYLDTNEDSLAIVYFNKSIKICKALNNKYGLAAAYSNLGLTNFKRKDYESAIKYHNKSLQITNEIGNSKGIAAAYNDLALVYNYLANLESAFENRNILYKKAIGYAQRSLEISEDVNVLMEQKNSYKQLSNSYNGLRNYKKAFKIQEKYIQFKDSLFSIEKMKEIEGLEALYQSEKKDLQINNLEKENELNTVRLEKMKLRQLLSFIIIIISTVFIIELLVVRRKLKNKNSTIYAQNEEILVQKDELETHRNHLEELVKERTQDLVIAKEKAEESDRLKSAFLANMSHEIRTPMNSIVGFTNLLNDPELNAEIKKELTSHINSNTDTLLKLIENIIDIAKIEAGQLTVEINECSVNDILDKIIPVYNEKKIALNKGYIDFIVHRLENNITINTDPLRVYQILVNLTDNAFKYTETGKIEIGLDILEDKNNESIKFFVKDTGIGLSKEQKEIIFKRFSKIEDDKKKLYRGAGLGLAISKNLIELLGGEIWVDSEKDKGSIFYFTIPY
ncbi:tetratricopeptide repeat protein [Bacteroidota bacterium]